MSRLFCILLLAITNTVCACSSFLLNYNGRHIVGKNYDWNIEIGRVLINKRGVCKTAFKVTHPISWKSKYGSVSFNQYGQEFPIGGMNEKGLVIEALWLNETVYPPATGDLPEIDNIQWIQFQLDNSASITDVINNDKKVQIHPLSSTAIHFFIADQQGKSLIIEAVDGALHHYLPDSTNPGVLTNDPYDKSLRLMQKCKEFGGNLEIPDGQGSVSRFIRAAVQLKNRNEKVNDDPVQSSFRILKSVQLRFLTKWSITYDLDNRIVYFKSASSNTVKSVGLNDLNFNCGEPVQFVNIQINKKGDILKYFRDYKIQDNHELLEKSISKTDFLKYSGKLLLQELSEYKNTLQCN